MTLLLIMRRLLVWPLLGKLGVAAVVALGLKVKLKLDVLGVVYFDFLSAFLFFYSVFAFFCFKYGFCLIILCFFLMWFFVCEF